MIDRLDLYTSPGIINLIWERGTPFPNIPSISVVALNGNPSSLEWRVVSQNTFWSHVVDSAGNQFGTLPFNIQGSLNLYFTDLDQHPTSNFQATVIFEGYLPNQPVVQVLTEINVAIIGEIETFPQAEKNRYSVVFNRSTNELNGDTIIDIVDNSANRTVTLDTNPYVFQRTTGSSQLEVKSNSLNPIPTNPAVPQTGTLEVLGRLKEGDQYSTPFIIDLLVVEDTDIHATINTIYMEQNLDNNMLTEINFTVLNPFGDTLSISAPDYVTVTNTPGNYQSNIRVKTNPSGNTTPKLYEDNLVLSLNTKTLEIPLAVLFTRSRLSTKPFALDGIYFLGARVKSESVFVRLNILMNFNVGNKTTEVDSTYVVPYIDSTARVDIGKIIHDFHPRFGGHSLFSLDRPLWNLLEVLHPAEIQINFEELDVDYEVLFEKDFTAFKVYPGNRPKRFPILTDFDTRSQFDSFTPIFSVIENDFDGSEFVDDFEPTGSFGNQGAVRSFILKQFHHLKESFKTEYKLKYLPVPAKAKQYVLQFLNQNLVPDWFIFSGEYTITTDYQHTHDEFKPNAKKYQTKSQRTLSIHTGLILKEEEKVLDAILKSPICFLKIEEKVYECFATTSKRVIENSQTNLTEHNIEFQIVKEWTQDLHIAESPWT